MLKIVATYGVARRLPEWGPTAQPPCDPLLYYNNFLPASPLLSTYAFSYLVKTAIAFGWKCAAGPRDESSNWLQGHLVEVWFSDVGTTSP